MKVSTALIIMLKNPIKGKAKTRLAKDIGIDKAHEVYLSLIDYTHSVTSLYEGPKYVAYAFHIDESDEFGEFDKFLQKGDALGERLTHALETVLPQHKTALFIGSDCAEITTDILHDADKALQENDVVIGPSHDGGYYLIGLTGNQSFLFENINWSTDQVFQQTIDIAKANNLTVAILPTLSDIDDLETLERYGGNITYVL